MADKVAAAVLVVLCVVALALSASALSSDVLERGEGEGSGPGPSDDPMPPPQERNTTAESPEPLLPSWVLEALIAGILLLMLPGLLLSDRYRIAGMLLGFLFFVGVVAFLVLFGGDPVVDPIEVMEPNGTDPGPEGGGESGSADESGNERPNAPTSLLTYGVLGLVLVAAVGLVFYATGSTDETTEPERTGADEEPDSGDIGAAAGRAAEHIETADEASSNAVYDAWREMTGVLPVAAPETTTPGEFADAAVDAGMDPADVAEITDLFEAVRYGDAPPSAERERAAIDALRRIEASYSGDADDGLDVPAATAGVPDGTDDASDETDDGPTDPDRGGGT